MYIIIVLMNLDILRNMKNKTSMKINVFIKKLYALIFYHYNYK